MHTTCTVRRPREYPSEAVENCGLWEAHEAFGNVSGITYMNAPLQCSSDSDCHPCKWGGHSNYCRDGYCADDHLQSVASRISASQKGKEQSGSFHAGSASLFIASAFEQTIGGFGETGLRTSPARLVSAYEWLLSNDVNLANESFVGVQPGFSSRHLIADWFARYRGLTLVQAAGNRSENIADGEVRCGGLSTICVGGVETKYSEVRRNHDFWQGSLWRNHYSTVGTALEIEKPDIAAEADGHMATLVHDSHWANLIGTSNAAPTVAGVLALFQEDCELRRGKDILGDPRGVRARLKTAMRQNRNWLEREADPPTCQDYFLYPTAQFPQCDYKTGVGMIDAEQLRIWCHPPCDPGDYDGECAVESALELSPEDEERLDVPDWMVEELEDLAFFSMRQRGGVSGLVSAQDSGVKLRKVQHFEDVPVGTSFRSTLSYDSCPTQAVEYWNEKGHIVPVQPGDLSTAVNFDFAICGQAGGEPKPHCIFHSDALHDSNEGFHVKLRDAYDWVSIFVIEPANWVPCVAEDGTQGVLEPAFVATIYGRGF